MRNHTDTWIMTIFAIVAVLVFFMIGWAVDYGFASSEPITATVSGKKHRSSWVQIISTGKSTSVIVHPESWNVSMQHKGETLTRSVSEDRFARISKGDEFKTELHVGCMTGAWY